MARFITGCMAVISRDGEFLMVKEGKPRAEDTWNLPCGGVDEDEDPRKAVRREVEEETGLKVSDAELLNVYLLRSNSTDETMLMFGFDCEVSGYEDVKVPDEDSVKDAEFKSLQDIEELDLRYGQLLEIIRDSLEAEAPGSDPIRDIRL